MIQPTMFDGESEYSLEFSDDELHGRDFHFRRKIEGGQWGGAQNFWSRLQQREVAGRLTVTLTDLKKAYWYGYAYGDGTWQKAFRAVVQAGMRAGWKPPQELHDKALERRRSVFQRGKQKPRKKRLGKGPDAVTGES